MSLDFGGLFEWIQDLTEERLGRAWSWVIYFALVGCFIGAVIWLISRA
jgi:hypothetical protein